MNTDLIIDALDDQRTDQKASARPKGALHVVGRVIDLSSRVALLAAGAFAVVQYLQSLQDLRVERTTQYITRYEDGNASVARRSINSLFRPYVAQFNELRQLGGVSPDMQYEIVKAIAETDEGHGLFDRIDTVVDFYEGLWTCVREHLCDQPVAEGYFASGEAAEFWNNFEPYILDRRANNPSFATGLEIFAKPPAAPATD